VYRKVEQAPSPAADFELPNGCALAADNRWVIMAQIIPWSEFEAEYAQNFVTEMGPPAKSFRLALGALIIKEKLGISDRETVEQIRENPCLQYFIGQSSYSNEAPFDPSLLVHFRQRISVDIVQYGSVKGYAVLKTINTGGFIMIPVPLCLTCLDRNFETGFFTTLGLFLGTLSGIF